VIKVSRSRSSELGCRACGQRHLIYQRLLVTAHRLQSPERSFRGSAFFATVTRLSGCPRAYLESLDSKPYCASIVAWWHLGPRCARQSL